MISFSCVDLISPRTYIICPSAGFIEPPLIPTTKQNNTDDTDKKLDFSTGWVLVQCDKSELKYKVFNSNKIHFEQLCFVDAN